MSYFKGLTLTKKGEQLQAKVNGNLSETLVFTKAKLGSGTITNDNEIRFLTDLKASWGEAMVSNCEIQGQDRDTVAIELQFSNQNLREDKIFREIGLYARGNDGQEVLYAYANAGENYDYIPIMQNSPHTFVIVIYFKITSGTKISATIDLKSYVTQEKLNVELAKKIDKTSISSSLTSTSTATVLSSAGAKVLEDKKLTRTINGDLEGLKRGTNGIFLSSGNTLNFSSHNNVYHFNYHTFPDSQQILEFYLNNGDSKGGMGDFYVKNLFTKGGYFEANANSETTWSQYRWRTKDGFWRFEAHPYSNNSGNKRMNLVYNNGSTDTYLSFPDIGNGDNVAYRSWVNAQRTWANVSGKPSVFNPASHTHSWAELSGKPNFVNVVDSTSTTDIATPRSVKLAYDKGVAALTEAQKKENAFAKNTAHNKNFGTTAGTVLEGNKIDQITGKTYGGILNTAGAKTAGKTYWDNNTKKLFLCKNNNSDTSANVNNYIALDNNSLLDRLENLNNSLKIINTFNSTLIMGNKTETDTGITIPSTCLFVSIEFEQMYSGTIRTIFSPLTLLKNTGYNYSEAFHSGGEYWQRLFFKVNTANKLTYTANWNSDKFKHAKLLKVIIYGF
ncbi:tail fiber protein [Fusobacterium gastrosuis]|uniref:tail fiber protein n=1 Tax=Fusobacterium gastrosuis TaxID=1755100 RepID=UPI002975C28E|nr:tail fiber protein [Fusobacteriaceae bacterium]MDY5712374.1 tail fiber protein [Fusobacterium gastrosuis]